jgi:bla regulator protein blaR1
MRLAYFSPLANHLWQSTLFAVAAWLLTLALRKNRAAVRYWIWLAASIKFLIPFSLLIDAGSQLAWRADPAIEQRRVSFVVDAIGRPFVSLDPAISLAGTTPPPSGLPAILLLSVWLLGVVIGITWWLRRWLRIRATQRTAALLDLNLPIPVMSSSAKLEPGVFGIRKPVLLLPEGIAERLTPDQLEAVLAHELCHFRRRDNLTGAIHMVVETIFWFHPLVWWIRARLVEERERACDDDVLTVISDARVYAEGILNVCKFYLESPLVCVSGVTGSNLKRRIEEIMAHRIAQNMNFGRKLLATAVGMAAVAAPIVIGMTNAFPLRAQSQPAGKLAFEVASIKLNASTDPRAGLGLQFLPGGKFVSGLPLNFVIATAYNLPFQSGRIVGGPDWIRTERYNIEATAEKGAIPAGATLKERNDKMRLMLQTLLTERFKMVIRRETKELPVYAIVVVKGGPKLQKAAIDEKNCPDTPTALGDATSCHGFGGGQGRGLHAQAVDMSDLAVYVSNWADRPVVDKTGIKGLFQIDTKPWAPMRVGPPPPPGAKAEDGSNFADLPSLFEVFEQLGLKLESQKAPIETFVIESAERPSEN